MGAFRWLLLLAGLFVLLLVFLYSTGRWPRWPRKRIQPDANPDNLPAVVETVDSATAAPDTSVATDDDAVLPPLMADSWIVTVRIVPREGQVFPAEQLVLALRAAGMRHGKYGIFHSQVDDVGHRIRYSAASLVEPGSFDLSKLKESSYPGLSLFMVLPAAEDGVALYDEMIAAARRITRAMDGRLTDEQGGAFSVQRERYMREEVIAFLANRALLGNSHA